LISVLKLKTTDGCSEYKTVPRKPLLERNREARAGIPLAMIRIVVGQHPERCYDIFKWSENDTFTVAINTLKFNITGHLNEKECAPEM